MTFKEQINEDMKEQLRNDLNKKKEIVFTYEYFITQEEVRKHIQECEGHHRQQIAYSSFHDALTQVCFGCKKVRTNMVVLK
jgi:uncharacterized protein YqeY